MKRTPKTAKAVPPALEDCKQYATPAELVHCAYVQNAGALEPWAAVFGALDMNGLSQGLKDATARVTKDGDMREPEAMLYGQAVALQTIFTNLSRRAAKNAGEYVGAADTYLRLALKAQAQCRATLETLHEMKNPRPVAFVRQANIAHGPQQVNISTEPPKAAEYAQASAHPGEAVSAPTELLEDGTHGRTQLDARTTAGAGREDSSLEPVGAVNRPAHR